jgi:N-methylhydantoinase B
MLVPNTHVKSDAITIEIIREKLQSIPDLVEADLTRTAFSPLIYEYKDYSVGMVDAEGRIIALARHGLPMFTASMIGCAVRDGLAIYGNAGIEPGDIIMTNHAGTLGQHLNNVVMYTPVFDTQGRLAAFMAIIVHWIDIGGRYPGSCAGTDTTELLQEGLQLRSVKLHRRGEPVEEIYRVVEYNTRLPEMLLGDIAAQVAGCIRGRLLFEELLERHGADVLLGAIDSIWESSEKAARAAVLAIPNGIYEMSSHLDDDGIDIGQHIAVNIKVRIQDGDFVVDFSDVGAQVRGPYNSGVYGGAETAARVAFKYLFTPDEPPNEGGFAPVSIIIPPGKFLSASPQAPLGKYSSTLATVTDTIIAAMARVMPDRVAAGHHASFGVTNTSGINPRTGQYFNYLDTAHGGWGGSARGDGVGPYKTIMHADNKDIPVEVQEALYPVRVERHEWRRDSAGAGRHRGGLGVDKTFLVLSPIVSNFSFERSSCPPWGLFGGLPGESGAVEIEATDGTRRIIHKASSVKFRAGDRYHVRSGGGGGFGSPLERDPVKVGLDVEQGYVSRERALDDYGAIVTFDGILDVEATKTRRAQSALKGGKDISCEPEATSSS